MEIKADIWSWRNYDRLVKMFGRLIQQGKVNTSKRRQRMKELKICKNFGWCMKKQECDLNIRMPAGSWLPCERMAHGADTITCSQTTSKSSSLYFQIFPVIGCQDQSWGKELGSAPASGWLGRVVEMGHFCYWCLIAQKPCAYYHV